MTKRRTLSDLEISQTVDELVIRARRMSVVVSMIAVFLLVPFSLFIAHQNIVGTADVPPIWDRPTEDRVFVLSAILILVLPWAIGPIAIWLMYLRKRRRAWVFSRTRGRLTRSDQSWPLAGLTAVAVDVRRPTLTTPSARVMLHWGDADSLEIARYYGSGGPKGFSLESRFDVAIQL